MVIKSAHNHIMLLLSTITMYVESATASFKDLVTVA